MAEFKLDDQQFAQVVGQQILAQMTTDARDKIITDAIVALNTPSSLYGGRKGPSPLQEAFNNAVTIAVNGLVRDLVEQSPVRDRIVEAANAFIAVFPDTWHDEALQTDVMAAIVRHARDALDRARD